jgi:hypothetical protein
VSAKLNNSANSLEPSSSSFFIAYLPKILNPSFLKDSILGPGPDSNA